MKLGVVLNSSFGRAFQRIDKAMHDYAPQDIQWTDTNESDFNIVHVVGGGEVKHIDNKSIIIQHCYFTTYGVNWIPYWEQSPLVVSFHDLSDYAPMSKFNFYRMPWGADERLFKYKNKEKRDIKVFTTGHVANTEAIDKVFMAVKILDKTMLHTGENFKWDKKYYHFLDYMDDHKYMEVLNNVQYVTGIRLIEGFEMACVEGLFCGAIPIVPKLDTYSFYNGFAKFVDPNGDLVEQLISIFKEDVNPLPEEVVQKAIERFSWQNLIPQLFSKIKELE